MIKYPIAQATMQLLIRHSAFPADFGKKSRTYFYNKFDEIVDLVKKAESEIPADKWIEITGTEDFDDMFLGVRLKLRDEHGAYDATMLKAMRKKRCAIDKSRSECIELKE